MVVGATSSVAPLALIKEVAMYPTSIAQVVTFPLVRFASQNDAALNALAGGSIMMALACATVALTSNLLRSRP